MQRQLLKGPTTIADLALPPNLIPKLFIFDSMSDQAKQWFDALTRDRSENADVLEKQSMRGVQRSVVDKYSDQAHFIYELLQNADDVRANTASFRLEKNGLYYTHNGPIRFSVSNPENEEEDTSNGELGHVNAITSIANSNKTSASIGKFGVGFKAVFQYTQTPHIYDPGIQFKITRFIVPQRLDLDLHWRDSSETTFFFPFDHQDKDAHDSHAEILEKLKDLEFPVLFLSNLDSVSFQADGVAGQYTKQVIRQLRIQDITAQWITLELIVNGERTSHTLLLFSRESINSNPIYIGYAIGETGKLIPIDRPAFCFFPTKEVTNLNFIVHAPFLLTDSREGIKAGNDYNDQLIVHLAQLAADSLPILRDEKLLDDGILDIIPYDESKFSSLGDKRRISFKPFFDAIKQKFQSHPLLPTRDGEYASKDCAYWAFDRELVKLFSDHQLSQLTGTKNARWVFPTRNKNEILSANKALANYIDGGDARRSTQIEPNLIVASLNTGSTLKKIAASFIAQQPEIWLHKLYAFLHERVSYQKFVKAKPIFLDQESTPVPAFDKNDQLVLFLPNENIEGFTTIKKVLLATKTTREFAHAFGIKMPSLHDEIYNKILPRYNTNEGIDTAPHFMKFFRYFKECSNNKVPEFIALVKDKEFLLYATADDGNEYRGLARDIYLPTTELKEWFAPKPDTKFLLLADYHRMVDAEDHAILNEFFRLLGVMSMPRVITDAWNPTLQEIYERNLSEEGSLYRHQLEDKVLDGCKQIILDINEARSLLLWRLLPHFVQNLSGRHTWFKYYSKEESFISTEELRLRSARWVLDKSGDFVSPDELTKKSLSDVYDISSSESEALIRFLGIREEVETNAHLSEEEARKIRLVDELEQSGLSEEEIRAAIARALHKKTAQTTIAKGTATSEQSPLRTSALMQEIDQRRPSAKRAQSVDQGQSTATPPCARPNDLHEDTDDYTPKPIDFSKKLDRAKDRYANELDRLEREQALSDKAEALPTYSYGWFLALLELECMACSEKNADGNTISIIFGQVELESESPRTIILKEPNRFIPQIIEEFSGVRVDFSFGNGQKRKLYVESFTAREFLLLGKLANSDELNGIDLGQVVEARIEVQNPSFLLHELLERFRELRLDETYDMKANLLPDIEFVFGPPGTGKTTHLAEKILIPMMKAIEPTKVLVLAPTNKAADVLTTRIMEAMGNDASYRNWLVRFGTSADDLIEKAGVWRDRSFDLGSLRRSVTVTTIARFAYDGYAVKYGSKKLCDTDWDLIVFDEASMISLSSIVHPLYCQKANKFIIAGDPFQIEPIVAVEQWKGENIYSLVGLNKTGSFANPATEPHDFLVTNLETQFRSLPSIGEIFSRFTYDGILNHKRASGTGHPLQLSNCDIQPLNIIKFPVSKFESIYRAKRLESGTSYQTYSALFTFEFVRWLASQIEATRPTKYSIGVIAPYRAQANLLNRLIDSWSPKPDPVTIQVGTIHGFQGDECDAIIALFNPPPIISANPQMFLNKQNILNVAISRARDHLFIVMPDEETEGIHNLRKVLQIENLIKTSGEFCEFESHAIEKLIWGKANYLEDNTFSTGHQMVNVYRNPEHSYEVRSDDSAIDVQIHGMQNREPKVPVLHV